MIKGLSTVKTIKLRNGTILLFATDHGCLARLNHIDLDDDIDWRIHGKNPKDALYGLAMLCDVVFAAFRTQWKIGNITTDQFHMTTHSYLQLNQEILHIAANINF